MNNLDSINRLVEELSTDEELVSLIEDLEVSEEDKNKVISCLTSRANFFNNSGIFIPYEEWKEIFLEVMNTITYTDYGNEEKDSNLADIIPTTVNRMILDIASIDMPDEIAEEFEKETQMGGSGRHF